MRTIKALACAAALAAGLATSAVAQNVYSLNVVGYINLDLTNGLQLVCNQLDLDGQLTNNTVACLGTNLPNLTKVYAFNPGSGTYSIITFSTATHAWIGTVANVNPSMAPGKGVFIEIPASAPNSTVVTLVGNVVQGTYATPVSAGLQILSSFAPISAGLQTGMGYAPTQLDKVYLFNPYTKGYSIRTFSTGTTWIGGEPTPAVGQAFFLQSVNAKSWTQTFNVPQT